MEISTIIISVGIFVIAWNSKKLLDNNYLVFIGIAFLFIALIDLLHTLSYNGMTVLQGFTGSNLPTQLWISARYLQAISMLLAIFFITRRLNYIILIICYFIVTALVILSIFYWKIFPAAYIEGEGLTTFKIASEYIICFIIGISLFFLYFYRREFNKTIFSLIISSMALSIASELFFTFYSSVFGFFNQLGHFFKLISFFLIYKAIIETGITRPIDLLFFKLKQSEKSIKDSEEKYHSLYSSMNEGSTLNEIIYDEIKKPVDYRILDANDTALSTLDVTKEQLIGKKGSDIYSFDITPFLDKIAQVSETGVPIKFENYFPHLKKYFLFSVFSPSKSKFATLFSDITEQKKIELEIESLSRFPMENPNPVMRMDDKCSIIFTNNAAKDLLQLLDNENKNKLLKLFYDSIANLRESKRNQQKTIKVRINKFFYEFSIIFIKNFDYYNMYGIDVTSKKREEILSKRIAKEKSINEERNKLARELHDTVTQTLFSANLTAEIIPKLWEKNKEDAIKKLEDLRRLNNSALMDMRILLYELRPSTLEDEDIRKLLQILIDTFRNRSKIRIEFTLEGTHKFSNKIELGFYRIAQEALNNIIKHSSATKSSLFLKSSLSELYMNITDNGRGFDDKKVTSKNLGLTIMKERVKLIGASLKIINIPGKGTSITVVYNKKQSELK